ncbi:putative glutathione-disulfide reductase [Helianthus annuus]|uniref:Glutathione-disulfide reductase n=1 Tax=Helianthus annuus TaxID=4232 RepID=A0A9K3I0V3_HELAN|nr:putative glutathione-disulfide reductase [Helianthus annuus]KAJ0881446.1 putative glutathione-disulfide reductase [Helianthus annuus]
MGYRLFAIRTELTNSAKPPRSYDFEVLTIGVSSGGVRASRFTANFGALVAVSSFRLLLYLLRLSQM